MNAMWLAGFFDGEGCINITVRGKNRQVVLRIMLANTDYALLQKIQKHFGGSLTRRPHKKHPEWKPFCCLTWTHSAAFALLHTLRPLLQLKNAQAQLALEFYEFQSLPKTERCELYFNGRLNRGGHRTQYRRTQETLAKELDFKRRMGILNQKGVLQ